MKMNDKMIKDGKIKLKKANMMLGQLLILEVLLKKQEVRL